MEIKQKVKHHTKEIFLASAMLPVVLGGCGGDGRSTTTPVKPPVTDPTKPVTPPVITPPVITPPDFSIRPKPAPQDITNRQPDAIQQRLTRKLNDKNFKDKLANLDPITSYTQPLTDAQKEIQDELYEALVEGWGEDTCTMNLYTQDEIAYILKHIETIIDPNSSTEIAYTTAGRIVLALKHNGVEFTNETVIARLIHELMHQLGLNEQGSYYYTRKCGPAVPIEDYLNATLFWSDDRFIDAALDSGKVQDLWWHATNSNQSLGNHWNENFGEIDYEKLGYATTLNLRVLFTDRLSDQAVRLRQDFTNRASDMGLHQEFDRLNIKDNIPPIPYYDDLSNEARRFFERASLAITDVLKFNENADNSAEKIQQHYNNQEAAQLFLDFATQYAKENGFQPTPMVIDFYANNINRILTQKRREDWYQDNNLQAASHKTKLTGIAPDTINPGYFASTNNKRTIRQVKR